tara:strand:- start:4 stop:618 length:615 start_codon:yes stop_codon:yes gene_type:complete
MTAVRKDNTKRKYKPLLIIVSGPSGVGKDSVIEQIRVLNKNRHFAITVTTRSPRTNEINGKDYTFVSKNAFYKMLKRNEMLEWAKVYGNLYGVPNTQVLDHMENGRDVMVKTDVQGAATIKNIVPNSVSIFLAPPSIVDLEKRLKGRMTESDCDKSLRLKVSQSEMEEALKFDYIVLNHHDKIDETVIEIESIISKERSKHISK